MKIRIKFAKYGTMKFIGHLDVMRFFQKVFRRADVDIAFSEGMSPHMILSFAAPLGLGAEGMSEYADIQINAAGPSLPEGYAEKMLEQMNQVSVEGIEFLDFRPIPDGRASKAMSLVAAADYAVRVRPGHQPAQMQQMTMQDWEQMWERFLAQTSIHVVRETKKGIKEADIRPWIQEITLDKPFAESKSGAEKDLEIHPAGENVPGCPVMYMRLATGSAANLKPEQVIDAFYEFAGFERDPFAVTVTRLELYAAKENGALCSLGEL